MVPVYEQGIGRMPKTTFAPPDLSQEGVIIAGLAQSVKMPPLTSMWAPVTKLDKSEARNSTTLATSSAVPIRRSGVDSIMAASRSGGNWAGMAVSITPGQTVLTRMPYGPPRLAIDLVRQEMAAWEAAESAPATTPPTCPPIEPMLMIRP